MIKAFLVSDLHIAWDNLFYLDKKLIRTFWFGYTKSNTKSIRSSTEKNCDIMTSNQENLYWTSNIASFSSNSNILSDINMSIPTELAKLKSESGINIAKINEQFSSLSQSIDQLNASTKIHLGLSDRGIRFWQKY